MPQPTLPLTPKTPRPSTKSTTAGTLTRSTPFPRRLAGGTKALALPAPASSSARHHCVLTCAFRSYSTSPQKSPVIPNPRLLRVRDLLFLASCLSSLLFKLRTYNLQLLRPPSRYLLGLIPYSSRNARLKFDTSPNPQSSATSSTFVFSLASRTAAFRNRIRLTYWCGVTPVNLSNVRRK